MKMLSPLAVFGLNFYILESLYGYGHIIMIILITL